MTTGSPTASERATNVRPLSPAAELDAYLRTIAGRLPGARLLEIRFALPHSGMGRVFLAAHSAPGAARFIRRLAARTDVYVGVAMRSRAAGGRNAIDRSHLAFVEIDATSVPQATSATPLRELQITGTPGHAHAYWTLSTPVRVPELERANRRLARRLGADLASVDAARILRPPATWNHKRSPPAPVQLLELNSARRYELEDLIDELDHPTQTQAPSPADRPRSGRTKIDRALLAIPGAEYARTLTGRSPNCAGKIACPFHDDHTPSLQLYEDGTWYCYGACQTGGSIYDFASRLWSTDTKGRAFLELRARLASELRVTTSR